jgi:hypothetical protein
MKGATVANEKKAPRGEGTAINIDLSDYPALLDSIREAAKKDDRPPSVWLRRKLVQLDEELFK